MGDGQTENKQISNNINGDGLTNMATDHGRTDMGTRRRLSPETRLPEEIKRCAAVEDDEEVASTASMDEVPLQSVGLDFLKGFAIREFEGRK